MRYKLSLTFEGPPAEILARLAKERGGEELVLRDALGLENIVVAAMKRNADIIIREPDGSVTQLVRI